MRTLARLLVGSLMILFTTASHPTLTGAEPIDRMVQSQLNSIAKVIGRSADGSVSYGTGVYIGGNYVMTAKHVLRGCNSAECFFDNGTSLRVQQAFDSNYGDQSILELNGKPAVRAAKLADADPAHGEVVTLAGFDRGRQLRFYDTTIGKAGAYNYGTVTDAMSPSISGNSGGPVFDSSGRVVGTLWGSDGRTTSLVNNSTTHRFLREVAQRYPLFGRCYQDACSNPPVITQPKPVTPMQPVAPQPSVSCDCEDAIRELAAALKSQPATSLTDAQLHQAIHDYLQRDPLTVTMILRNPDGTVSEGSVDVAKVIPVSELTAEQQALVRESLQLTPARNR